MSLESRFFGSFSGKVSISCSLFVGDGTSRIYMWCFPGYSVIVIGCPVSLPAMRHRVAEISGTGEEVLPPIFVEAVSARVEQPDCLIMRMHVSISSVRMPWYDRKSSVCLPSTPIDPLAWRI